jgi:predicted alpha/beta-hydrolase family hydrolase
VQAGDRDTSVAQLFREVDREQDLRELALTVGARAAVAAGQHDVGEVDRLLPGRGDVDDARRGARLDQREQQRGQQKTGEVIDRKAQFEPVGALLAGAAGGADAGVVDQDVEPIRRLPDRGGKAAHLGQVREIGWEERCGTPATLDLGDDAGAALRVAAMHQDARPGRPEPRRNHPPDSVGRAGDERGLAREIGHRASIASFATRIVRGMAIITPFEKPGIRGFLHHSESGANGDGLVLTHGAGGNAASPLLAAVADAFTAARFTVLRCDLPFRQKRPRGPPSPSSAAADRAGLRDAAEAMRERVSGRVVLGGVSYGGRQATILAADEPRIAAALILFSYPLHPPGRPEQLRTEHFPRLRLPALFVQGTRDPFGAPEELRGAIAAIPAPTRIIAIAGAGHDLKRGGFDLPAVVAALRELADPLDR